MKNKLIKFKHENSSSMPTPGWGGVPLEKLGRGVRPAFQNPFSLYDQNLSFSLPYIYDLSKTLIPYL